VGLEDGLGAVSRFRVVVKAASISSINAMHFSIQIDALRRQNEVIAEQVTWKVRNKLTQPCIVEARAGKRNDVNVETQFTCETVDDTGFTGPWCPILKPRYKCM
jgi:hypothetical protein